MDKLKEAKKAQKKGDRALKRGIFKWSKDYLSAALNYDEAVKLYRSAKKYDEAEAIYEKLINVNKKLKDSWAVGRNYESIVTMNIERDDGVKVPAEKLVRYTNDAGSYFKTTTSSTTYFSLAKKVAKFLDTRGDLEDSMALYKELLKDLQNDDPYVHSDLVPTYASLLMRAQKYSECANLFEREYAYQKGATRKSRTSQNLATLALTIIALNLIIEEGKKAEKKLQEFSVEIPNFTNMPEFSVSEMLLEAYHEGRQVEFEKCAQASVINTIFPLTIIKELRKVKVRPRPIKRKAPEVSSPPEYPTNRQQSLKEEIDFPVKRKATEIQTPSVSSKSKPNLEEVESPVKISRSGAHAERKKTLDDSEAKRQKILDDFLC